MSALGSETFKVFNVGTDKVQDRIEIQGTTGNDDYRVQAVSAIGVDGTAKTALRYEQLNGQVSNTGELQSHVVVDVFDLDNDDYVRLNTFTGNDRIDATEMMVAVVDKLYLDGGADDDRIIGSDLTDVIDVIIGGLGSDRVTGGAGVDEFFEVDDTSDTNQDVLQDTDTLFESRDANFRLTDRSLKIDDSSLANQFGNEQETFADIFEFVELHGFDSANQFEISGLVRQRAPRRLHGGRYLQTRAINRRPWRAVLQYSRHRRQRHRRAHLHRK